MENPNAKFMLNMSPVEEEDFEKAKAMLGSPEHGMSGDEVAEDDLRVLPEVNIEELAALVRKVGDGTVNPEETLH